MNQPIQVWMGALLCLAMVQASAEEPGLTYEKDVRPILKAHCFHCHGEGQTLEAGLDVRLKGFLEKGGDSGAAIVVGKPADSFLIQRVRAGEMPPGDKKLSPDEIAVVEKWIAAGAKTARPEPENLATDDGITPEDREFWSFQPIRRPPVPQVEVPADQRARLRTPVDAFLMEKLAANASQFNPDADKRTLLRRAYLDLLGLPPTPTETEQFLSDDSPDAYEKLLDRLLASPHYGERWGRHWLDAAGYAESDGYSDADPVRPYAYKYRDYVIRAMNEDKPIDVFLKEQLAGDEMIGWAGGKFEPYDLDRLIATGYLRMSADGSATPAIEADPVRNQVVSDTIKIVTTSLLGLTVGCAQCHDHRYDPIPQTDYYRIRAVFEPAYDWKNWRVPAQRVISLYTEDDHKKAAEVAAEAAQVAQERAAKQEAYITAALEKELQKFPEEQREGLRLAYRTPAGNRSPEQTKFLSENPSLNINPGNLYQYDAAAAEDLKKFDAKIGEIQAKRPPEDFVAALWEIPGSVPTTFRFHRGDHRQPKEAIDPGGLTVCAPPGKRFEIPADDTLLPSSGRRTAFAAWITSEDNPLTARVLVNRVWMHHFGKGIVGTPADFGAMGEEPTHPELLDWLASEFRAGGWRMKRLHKVIMMSTAYRQTSQITDQNDEDPDNRLYGRFPLQRLDAEVVRDRILATAGALDRKMFGPSVAVTQDGVGQIVVGDGGNRRSVYIQVRRSQPVSFLSTFDAPVMETNCDRRTNSTVAPQALMLMNSDFVVSEAGKFADRLRQERGTDPVAQTALAWELAYQRPASDREMEVAKEFLTRQTEHLKQTVKPVEGQPEPDHARQALASLCQTLFSSNEFLYLD